MKNHIFFFEFIFYEDGQQVCKSSVFSQTVWLEGLRPQQRGSANGANTNGGNHNRESTDGGKTKTGKQQRKSEKKMYVFL